MMFEIPYILKSFRFNPFTPAKVQIYINQLNTLKASGLQKTFLKNYTNK